VGYSAYKLRRITPSGLFSLETCSVLWNILISNDKNFSSTSYKNLKKKIRSMDIFKELTFKETSTTTTNFRRKDFIYI